MPAISGADVKAARADAGRLAVLHAKGWLAQTRDPVLDELSRLASTLVDAPIAFVCVIDADRNVVVGAHGLSSDEVSALSSSSRGIDLADRTLLCEDIFALDDVRGTAGLREDRTSGLVDIGAFAGAPLRSDGRAVLGSLCVADGRTRAWTPEQRRAIESLGSIAASHLEQTAALRGGEQLAALAEQTLGEREDGLAAVVHDMKSPLSSVLMALPMLDAPDPALRRRGREIVERGALQLKALVKDLGDASLFERDRFSLALEPVAAAILLDAARLMMQSRAQRAGIRLVGAAVDRSLVVRADAGRVMRVFANLIGNALKFAARGTAVSVGCSRVGAMASFRVVDEGPGIAADDVGQVFGRFWQARSGDRRGMGLGLAISKAIVEAHGGTIGVESTPGRGSAFHFTLPLVDAIDGHPAPAP